MILLKVHKNNCNFWQHHCSDTSWIPVLRGPELNLFFLRYSKLTVNAENVCFYVDHSILAELLKLGSLGQNLCFSAILWSRLDTATALWPAFASLYISIVQIIQQNGVHIAPLIFSLYPVLFIFFYFLLTNIVTLLARSCICKYAHFHKVWFIKVFSSIKFNNKILMHPGWRTLIWKNKN